MSGPTLDTVNQIYEDLFIVTHPLKKLSKIPIVTDWPNITDKTFLPEFIGQSEFNIGMITGHASKVIVLDCDRIKNDDPNKFVDGVKHFEELQFLYPEIGETLSVRTPSGGRHYYYSLTDDIIDIAKMGIGCIKVDGKKIKWDILGINKDGGGMNCVMPPSCVEYNGSIRHYEWNLPDKMQPQLHYISDMPQCLVDYLREHAIKKTEHRIQEIVVSNDGITKADAEALVAMISADTMNSYNGWINLGLALRSIGAIVNDDNWAYNTWLSKSSVSGKSKLNKGDYDPALKWCTFNVADGIGILYNMAREDNATAYVRWLKQKYQPTSDIFADVDLVKPMMAIEKEELIGYKIDDEYYLYDYIGQYSGTVSTKNAGLTFESMIRDLSRVVCKICSGAHFVVIKVSPKMPFVIEKLSEFKKSNTDSKISYIENGKRRFMSIFEPLYQDKIKRRSLINVPYPPIRVLTTKDVVNNVDFNIFPGFKAKIVNEVNYSLIEPILDHIRICWANRDEKRYKYVLSHLAHVIQKPHIKSKICLILMSENQQIGKGAIVNFFIDYVLGDALGVTIPDIDELVGQFTSRFAGKLYINIDEPCHATSETYHRTFNVLKNLITEPKMRLEEKRVKSETIESCCNFIITTNNDVPVKLEKGDARYTVFKCNEEFRGNREYFNRLHDSLNQETANHFMTYLMNYDMVELRNIPETEERTQMIEASRPTAEIFIDSIKNGDIILSSDEIIMVKNGDKMEHMARPLTEASGADIHREYERWCKSNNHKNIVSNSSYFGRLLTKAFGERWRRRDGNEMLSMYKLPEVKYEEVKDLSDPQPN